jgi:hypothetical protein
MIVSVCSDEKDARLRFQLRGMVAFEARTTGEKKK